MEKGKIELTQKDAENTPAGGVVVGKRDGQTMIYDDASLGGYFVGKLHKDGGIKMINKSTGQPLEVQGSEVIITAPAVYDQTKRNFEGKMMTNREILSKINSDGGGVSFADGGDIPAKIHTADKEYEYGGKMVHDSEIANHLGMNSTLKKGKQNFSSGGKTYDVDAIYNAIKKGKLRLKTKEVETFPMKYPVYDKKYSETVKTDFRKPNGLTVRTESGEEVLIDGNHRMNNAYLKGRKTMKTYYIEDPKQIANFTKKNKFELGGENKDFDDLVKTKFLEGYGKIKHFELTNFGGSWKYINNQNVTSSQRDKMPVYVIETSNDIKDKARQISKDYKSSQPKEISILDFAEKFTKDNNGKIYHKSKSGSVYVKIYQNGHPKEIRISDHYILDRDSLNPKVRYDLEIVQKNFDETTPSNLDYWTDEFELGGNITIKKDPTELVGSKVKIDYKGGIYGDKNVDKKHLKTLKGANSERKQFGKITDVKRVGNTNKPNIYDDFLFEITFDDGQKDDYTLREINFYDQNNNYLNPSFSSVKLYADGGHLSKNKSLKQIAEMHNVSLAHVNEELAKGLEVEKEHFSDFKERTRVAKDHLVENPNYYTILEKAGLKDGGHLIHHRHNNNLVKDAKSGNTPARDLNNYNDIMDLEADGMVGMESGLAFADGGITPYDANAEGDSIAMLNTGGGVGLPKVAFTLVSNAGASLSQLIGSRYNSYIEFAESVEEAYKPFINIKPIRRSFVELEAYDENDNKLVSVSTYIADQKNTVKNFNPTTGNYKNLEKSLANSRPISFKKFDWQDWLLSKVKPSTASSQRPTSSNFPEYYEFVGDSIDSFTKGKIYKINYPNDLEAENNFIDNDGLSNGFSLTNYIKFKPSTEQAFLTQQGITSGSSSLPLDLSNTKVWVGDDERLSKAIQEVAFELGWEWSSGKKMRYTDSKALYFDSSKNMARLVGSRESFDNNPNKELNPQDILLAKKAVVTTSSVQTSSEKDVQSVLVTYAGGKIYNALNEERLLDKLVELWKDGGISNMAINLQPQGFVTQLSNPVTVILDNFTNTLSNTIKPTGISINVLKELLSDYWFPELNWNYFFKDAQKQTSTPVVPKTIDDKEVTSINLSYEINGNPTYYSGLRTGKDFIEAINNIEEKNRNNDVRVSVSVQYKIKDKNGNFSSTFETEDRNITFGKGAFVPSNWTVSEIKSIVSDDWFLNVLNFDKIFSDIVPTNVSAKTPNVLEPYEASKVILEWKNKLGILVYRIFITKDSMSGKEFIDELKSIEKDSNGNDVAVIIQANAKDSKGNEFERTTEFNIGENWFKPSRRTNEQIKSIVANDWIDGITFDKFFEDVIPLSGTQTPTSNNVNLEPTVDKKFTDFKEAVNALEGFASQASKKYNTTSYEENLQLLKEVKEEYSLALSFTPESSFMYERIELMKKINEVQKEITRITELKNGGAFYILAKVVERLEKGDYWKESGRGEIMINEVPEQEIESVIYTEKFKNWFGNWEEALITKEYDYVSKALTKSGKPSVMFHGAKRIKYSYRQVSNGVLYLAENRSYAEWFSANESPYQKQGDYLTQCFVNLKNPIDLTVFGVEEVDLRDIIQFIDTVYPLAKIYDVLPPNVAMSIMNNQLIGRNFRAWYIIRQFPELNKHIRDNTDYDGFIYYENNPSDIIISEVNGEMEDNVTKATAVFNSNQVKLVDAMLFDSSLEDWRFEQGGKVN